jgi:hypothetical protein
MWPWHGAPRSPISRRSSPALSSTFLRRSVSSSSAPPESTASLDKRKIPSGDVRVHGSALHSKTPGDIDVAVIVDEATFDKLAAQFKSGAKGDANSLKALASDVGKGKISSSNFYPDAKPSVANEMAGAAGSLDAQVSVIKAGTEFDVGPYLNK